MKGEERRGGAEARGSGQLTFLHLCFLALVLQKALQVPVIGGGEARELFRRDVDRVAVIHAEKVFDRVVCTTGQI